MTALPVGLSSQILERRPDIRQAEYRLKAAHAKVGVAYTSMFPKFTLTGHYGLESSDLTDFLKAPYFFVGGELLAPVFNLGKNRARLKASRAVQEQETYNYQKVVLQAFTEVSNALVNSRKSREIRESREHLEQSARSNLDLATLQYINGVISYLDVLDAQRGYFDASIRLSATNYWLRYNCIRYWEAVVHRDVKKCTSGVSPDQDFRDSISRRFSIFFFRRNPLISSRCSVTLPFPNS